MKLNERLVRAMIGAIVDPSIWSFFGVLLLAVGITGTLFSPHTPLAFITALVGISFLFIGWRLKQKS